MISFSFFKKQGAIFQKWRVSLRREDLLIGGVVLLLFFALSVVGWDAYFYYATFQRPKAHPLGEQKLPSISDVEIDETIRILNEREKKLNELFARSEKTTTSPVLSQ